MSIHVFWFYQTQGGVSVVLYLAAELEADVWLEAPLLAMTQTLTAPNQHWEGLTSTNVTHTNRMADASCNSTVHQQAVKHVTPTQTTCEPLRIDTVCVCKQWEHCNIKQKQRCRGTSTSADYPQTWSASYIKEYDSAGFDMADKRTVRSLQTFLFTGYCTISLWAGDMIQCIRRKTKPKTKKGVLNDIQHFVLHCRKVKDLTTDQHFKALNVLHCIRWVNVLFFKKKKSILTEIKNVCMHASAPVPPPTEAFSVVQWERQF